MKPDETCVTGIKPLDVLFLVCPGAMTAKKHEENGSLSEDLTCMLERLKQDSLNGVLQEYYDKKYSSIHPSLNKDNIELCIEYEKRVRATKLSWLNKKACGHKICKNEIDKIDKGSSDLDAIFEQVSIKSGNHIKGDIALNYTIFQLWNNNVMIAYGPKDCRQSALGLTSTSILDNYQTKNPPVMYTVRNKSKPTVTRTGDTTNINLRVILVDCIQVEGLQARDHLNDFKDMHGIMERKHSLGLQTPKLEDIVTKDLSEEQLHKELLNMSEQWIANNTEKILAVLDGHGFNNIQVQSLSQVFAEYKGMTSEGIEVAFSERYLNNKTHLDTLEDKGKEYRLKSRELERTRTCIDTTSADFFEKTADIYHYTAEVSKHKAALDNIASWFGVDGMVQVSELMRRDAIKLPKESVITHPDRTDEGSNLNYVIDIVGSLFFQCDYLMSAVGNDNEGVFISMRDKVIFQMRALLNDFHVEGALIEELEKFYKKIKSHIDEDAKEKVSMELNKNRHLLASARVLQAIQCISWNKKVMYQIISQMAKLGPKKCWVSEFFEIIELGKESSRTNHDFVNYGNHYGVQEYKESRDIRLTPDPCDIDVLKHTASPSSPVALVGQSFFEKDDCIYKKAFGKYNGNKK